MLKTTQINQKIVDIQGELKKSRQYQNELNSMQVYQGEDRVISLSEALEEIKVEKKKTFITTTFPKLNDIIGGFRAGQLIVISGATGHGKTTLCQNLTQDFLKENLTSLWFSYEVDLEEFADKFGEEIPLVYLPRQLKENSILWLNTKITEAIAKYNCRVVFIDHLHYLLEMQKMAEAKSISLLVGMMMRELKKIAIKHGIILFLVSHMRKTLYEKEPELEDLRDSSFTAQESDMVLFIMRAKENRALLKVAKNRRTGKLGMVKLLLNNNQFKEIDEYHNDS